MLSTLFGMPVNFICFGIECVKFLRDVLPFISGLGMLPECNHRYFSSSMSILSYYYDQLCSVILCRFKLSHLKRQDSAVVPGISEEMSSQLSLTLWMSATERPSCSQCLQMSQIKILRSHILQFLLSFLVLVILYQLKNTSLFFFMPIA